MQRSLLLYTLRHFHVYLHSFRVDTVLTLLSLRDFQSSAAFIDDV